MIVVRVAGVEVLDVGFVATEGASAGFLAAAAVPVAVEDEADDLTDGLTDDALLAEGATEVRRAAVVDETVRFFSSSEADGLERWVAVDEAVVGRLVSVAVVPVGGRVGGFVRPEPAKLVRVVLVVPEGLVATLLARPGRRAAVVAGAVPTMDVRFAALVLAIVLPGPALGEVRRLLGFVDFVSVLGLNVVASDTSPVSSRFGDATGTSADGGASFCIMASGS